jgi:hypothetical protein
MATVSGFRLRRVAYLREMIADANEQIKRQRRERRVLSAWDLREWEQKLKTTAKDLDERAGRVSTRELTGIPMGTPIPGEAALKAAAKDLLEEAKRSGELVQELEYLNERRQKVMDELAVVRDKLSSCPSDSWVKMTHAVTKYHDTITAAGTLNTVDTLRSIPLSDLTDGQCEKLHRDHVLTNRGFGARDPNHPRNRFDRSKFEDEIRRAWENPTGRILPINRPSSP